MAGHSKFANIKHRKEREDIKRGKIFTKLGRDIIVAVKIGGKDPNFNPRLRLALDKARAANMPKNNIEKAIKRGAGEIDGEQLSEVRYEGYGPHGVAIIVEVLTDNKNRSASEIRHAFNRFNGSLGENSVGWLFDRVGLITIDRSLAEEEEIFDIALDSGAVDVLIEEEYRVLTDPLLLYEVSDKIDLDKKSVEIVMMPKDRVILEGEDRERVIAMLDFIDSLDDVQNIYSNLEDENVEYENI